MKTVEIVAGPNGSGKTTFAETYFPRSKKRPIFINPDLIAKGISPFDAEKAAFQAGRLMLAEIHDRLKKGESFVFESTLSGKTWLPLLKTARRKGYRIVIYFLYLDQVKENLKRIQMRVKAGGHAVPAKTVLRRYPRTFRNFWRLYRPLCSRWIIFNNSGRRPAWVCSNRAFMKFSEAEKAEFEQFFLKRNK